MAETHRICVYASLPLKVTHGEELELCASNWVWVQCFDILVDTLETCISPPRPLKWIRYAIGVIIGAQGDLYTSPNPEDSPNHVDYDGELPVGSPAFYYRTSDEERQRMFPIDPNFLRTCLTSSDATTGRGSFHTEVASRDGQQCVWVGHPKSFCEAVHLVAHNKTDKYITTLTRHRARDNAVNVITDIDDARNGLFLTKSAHAIVGKQVAFLKTPNFAMNTDDVVNNLPPEQKRYTAHVVPTEQNFPERLFAQGSTLRISDSNQWPPDILFDVVYASFVLSHFGTAKVKHDLAQDWDSSVYSDGAMTAEPSNAQALADERATAAEKKRFHNRERDARYEKRQRHLDSMDILMALPYLMVPSNERQKLMRAVRDEAEVGDVEQRDVQEKVEGWIRQVNAA